MPAQNLTATRRRGARSERSRAILEVLREPGTLQDVMSAVKLERVDAWGSLKQLHQYGQLERLSRGVYRTSTDGLKALDSRRRTPKAMQNRITTVPEGTGWTVERIRWLEDNYPRLGYVQCGALLGVHPHVVHKKATKLGLRFGEVPGYLLLTDACALLNSEYTVLYARARRAGVLTWPGSVDRQQHHTKCMVPERWVEAVANETQLAEQNDVALATLRSELGLSRTQASRAAGSRAYLRTPLRGGQATLHVPYRVAEELRRRYKNHRITTAPVGRAGVLAALTAAGPEGYTERELDEQLGISRTAIRGHLTGLLKGGLLERCRSGDSVDPFVFRLAEHTHLPQPQQRKIILPGRPRKTPLQAAD